MKTHFFQRYHSKENVDTANAMLLLNRLYSYSSDMFFSLFEKNTPREHECRDEVHTPREGEE